MSLPHIVPRRTLSRRLSAGTAVAVMMLTASVTVPSLAAAQTYADAPPPSQRQYDEDCHKNHTGGTFLGALIGAGIGAVLGVAIAANGHGGDGAALGAGLGAVGGGVVGSNASRCPNQPPAPPPPPQQGAVDPNEGYRDAPPPGPPPGGDQGAGQSPGR